MNMGTMRVCWALLIGVALLVGCADRAELKLKRAQIALDNDRPRLALKICESILGGKPSDPQATIIMARAQTRLQHLEPARQTVQRLIQANPDSAEAHRMMATVVLQTMQRLFGQSGFAIDQEQQFAFDDELALAQSEIEWLEEKDHGGVDTLFLRGQFAELDARRYERRFHAKRRSLRDIDLDADPNDDTRNQSIKREMTLRLSEAEDYLVEALQIQPDHFDVMDLLIKILVEREKWSDLWVLAHQAAELKDIPDKISHRLVMSLLSMPADLKPLDQRVAIGWELQSAVSENLQRSAKWKITNARLHLRVGEFDDAVVLLESISDRTTTPLDRINSRFLLAESLYGQGRFGQAKKALDRLAGPMSQSAQIQRLYGLILMQSGDKAMAKEAFRRATELRPDDALARQAIVSMMVSAGEFEAAESDIDKLYRQNPADPTSIAFKLRLEQFKGRRQAVRDLLEHTEQFEPLTDDHLSILIDGSIYLRDNEAAHSFAQRLVEQEPDKPGSHLKRAETMLVMGQVEAVQHMLIKLRKKFPASTRIDVMLGRVLFQQQLFDRAIDVLELVVQREPENHKARLVLAKALANLTMIDDSLEQIDQVLDKDPQNVEGHALAMRLYGVTGEIEKANGHLSHLVESQVNAKTKPVVLAQITLKQDDLDAAAAICHRAIAEGDQDPQLWQLLATINLRRGDLGQAELHLLAVARMMPNSVNAYDRLAKFYLNHKMVDKGLAELSNLQVLNEPLSRLGQATLLRHTGEFAAALEVLEPIYERAIGHDSRVASVVADAMAQVHRAQGNWNQATAIYERLKAVDPLTNWATLRQIDLVITREPADRTVARLDEFVEDLKSERGRLRRKAIRRYIQLGREVRALEVVKQWVALEPKVATLHQWMGELLLETGRSGEAVAAFEQALALDPVSLKLWRALAVAHVANYDYPGAERALIQMGELDPGIQIESLARRGLMYADLGLNHQATTAFEALEGASRARDPRVNYAMGKIFATLGHDGEARRRLAEVPKYATQFNASQLLLSRIEQRQGMTEQARKRLETLARKPGNLVAVTNELLSKLSRYDDQDLDLLKWGDQVIAIDQLSKPLRQRWLVLRLGIAADDGDWERVLETLDHLTQMKAEIASLDAARVAVMIHLEQVVQARQMVETGSQLASPAAALLATALQLPDVLPPDSQGLPAVICAMAKGSVQAARSAIENLPPQRTAFRNDLSEMLDRFDRDSGKMNLAGRQLAVAWVALEAGLPQLCTQISGDVIHQKPHLSLAYSLRIEAAFAQRQGIDSILEQTTQSLPKSDLTLFLLAHAKSSEGDELAAAAAMEQLLQREPNNVHVRYKLSQRYLRLARVEKAIEVLDRIWSSPDDPYRLAAGNDLAYLLAEDGELDRAHRIAVESLSALNNNPAVRDTLGWIEHLRGQNEGALNHLSRAIPALKDLPVAHYHIARVYQALGNDQWSRYHLREAAASDEALPEVSKAKAILADWSS